MFAEASKSSLDSHLSQNGPETTQTQTVHISYECLPIYP